MTGKSVNVDYDGVVYIWNGKQWFNAKTFEAPPRVIVRELELRAARVFEEQDSEITDFQELLTKARDCKASGQLQRALRLAQTAASEAPEHVGAHAVLCSCLRELNRPREALEATAHLARCDYSPLLTSRAAAHCDLLEWEQAKKAIAKVLAIGKQTADAFLVVNRIKSARPDLYR